MNLPCDQENYSFSQRNGFAIIPQPLQLEELTPQFRNELDAILRKTLKDASVCDDGDEACYNHLKVINWIEALHLFWVRKLGRPYIEYSFNECAQGCLNIIRAAPFNEVADLIEELLGMAGDAQPAFSNAIKDLFSRHQSPYIIRRISNDKWWIIETGHDEEREEVMRAFSATDTESSEFICYHLEQAGHALSKREFAYSIEHSLKALEAQLRVICKDHNKSGGALLQDAATKCKISKHFFRIINALWTYRSDAPDIAHAMKQGSISDQFDARAIYVMCCSVVNYLISTCSR